jgi:ABC-type glycerol-3-phosphate transport system substrate-binding protein
MRTLTLAAAAAIGAIAMSQIPASDAAEIRVISANGMRDVLAETKAKFEADTGHRLTITVVETGEIRIAFGRARISTSSWYREASPTSWSRPARSRPAVRCN